jgi:hypothetical protein
MARRIWLRIGCPASSVVKNPELPCRGTSGFSVEMRLARTLAQFPRRNSFYTPSYRKPLYLFGFPIPCQEFRSSRFSTECDGRARKQTGKCRNARMQKELKRTDPLPIFVRTSGRVPNGNAKLVQLGAIPFPSYHFSDNPLSVLEKASSCAKAPAPLQKELSLFDHSNI